MAWPTDAVATGELITAAQLNGLPVRIANTTLSGSAANIDFQSIPGHYAHLLLVMYLRTDQAVTSSTIFVRFNNDSAGNYDYQFVQGSAAVASASEAFAGTAAGVAPAPGNSAGANLFDAVTFDVPHYANSANNKAFASTFGSKVGTASGNMTTGGYAGFWRSSAAITRVTILSGVGNLVSGSRATLYGVA